MTMRRRTKVTVSLCAALVAAAAAIYLVRPDASAAGTQQVASRSADAPTQDRASAGSERALARGAGRDLAEQTSARKQPQHLLASALPAGYGRTLPAPGVPTDPEARERARVRSARAHELNARLERRIAVLRERLPETTGAEREALERDLRTLEKNLRLRRRQETFPRAPATRPGVER